jgi:hypothetical protein
MSIKVSMDPSVLLAFRFVLYFTLCTKTSFFKLACSHKDVFGIDMLDLSCCRKSFVVQSLIQ